MGWSAGAEKVAGVFGFLRAGRGDDEGCAEGGYAERWRGGNSGLHDDWRRRGDVVVWYLRDRDGRKDAFGGKKSDFQS